MNGSPDGEVLADIEREVARSDPALAALFDRFLADSLGSGRRPAPPWPRLVLAFIAVAVVVVAAVLAAIFGPPGERCSHARHQAAGNCAPRSAGCGKLAVQAPQCEGDTNLIG